MPQLLSILGHHSEPGDPVLIDWMLHLFQSVVALGPLAIVIVLGTVIVAIPVVIMAAFLTQRAKYNS
jgi:hypothetical protein